MDLVLLVSGSQSSSRIEETSTQVQVAFMDALDSEGLLELVDARQDTVAADPSPFDAAVDVPRRCCSPSRTTGRR